MALINLRRIVIACALTTLLVGCDSKPSRVNPPAVDPSGAANAAMQQYDTNGDGMLSAEELVACPGILKDLELFDANSDGGVSEDEIAARIQSWLDSGTGLMSMHCTVNVRGQGLEGATVKFIPESFLGDAVKTASGVTADGGMAVIGIAEEDLPEEMQGDRLSGMMMPGIYRVEVTHPDTTIAARYNSETTLGQEISQDNPAMQTGITFEVGGM